MKRVQIRSIVALATLLIVAPVLAGAVELDDGRGDVADVGLTSTALYLQPTVEAEFWVLTLTGPCGPIQKQFDSKDEIFFDLRDLKDDPNGQWTWELRRMPSVDKSVRQALQQSRGTGNEQDVLRHFRDKGQLPKGPMGQAGGFFVADGVIVDPESGQEGEKDRGEATTLPLASAGVGTPGTGAAGGAGNVTEKQIINGNAIVYNSICVGFDCPNSPSFGSDTIRLQENNLRIHFDDTSVAASFPNQDWRIEANSNLNGGGEYLRFVDATAGRNIATFEANAPSNSLVIDSGGRAGFGTANPVVELHSANGDTPTLRLEQTTASGFAAQSWDVAGNETSFFVRDVTNGSTLPFRIRPGASSNTLSIDSDSDVGIGILTADEKLHVTGSDGATKLLVEETNGTANGRQMMELRNNGNVNFILVNTNAGGDDWQMIADTGGAFPGFSLSLQGSGTREFRVAPNGDIIAGGAVVHASSRTFKENFVDLDPRQVLTRVTELPITQWNYTKDGETLRHVGPMAEDFHAAFGLGSSEQYIAVSDSIGVTMAAVQGLNEMVEEKDREIAELTQTVDELRQGLAELEALVRSSAEN